MNAEKNHKNIFAYKNHAVSLESVLQIIILGGASKEYGRIIYRDSNVVNISHEMVKALLVELSLVTVTESAT